MNLFARFCAQRKKDAIEIANSLEFRIISMSIFLFILLPQTNSGMHRYCNRMKCHQYKENYWFSVRVKILLFASNLAKMDVFLEIKSFFESLHNFSFSSFVRFMQKSSCSACQTIFICNHHSFSHVSRIIVIVVIIIFVLEHWHWNGWLNYRRRTGVQSVHRITYVVQHLI